MRSSMTSCRFRGVVLLLSSLCPLCLCGNSALADPKKPTYDEDVLPILKLHCAKCHDNEKQKGGLNLTTFAALQQGGSSGVAVVAGSPNKSRLYVLTTHAEEPKMPPSG